MQKRVFIVHGWGGFPKEGWFPWLKKELEKRGFKVEILSMPNTDNPKIKTWVNHLSKAVKIADKKTYFVGHSIGCQTILRYFEKLPLKTKVGGALFVAGWFNLKKEAVADKDSLQIAKPWLETKIDFSKVLIHTKKFVAIFSSNDPFVSLADKKVFENKLKAKTVLEENKGHFSGSDKIKELPAALKELIIMSS